MPRGAYTAKQDRKAEHIEEEYEKRGVSVKEAERRAWTAMNRQDKGGKKAGNGRKSNRSEAAKNGSEVRRSGKGGDLRPAFQNLDRAFDRAQLTVREALELGFKWRTAGDAGREPVASVPGQTQCQTAPVIGILRALNESGSHECVH